jgi:hypothetical protein
MTSHGSRELGGINDLGGRVGANRLIVFGGPN